jgi:hypothetical protein
VKAPLALSLAAAAILTVAGCSHHATSSGPTAATSASSAPTVSPTPTPNPTPTLPTVEQARETYLRLVVPSDKAIEAYNKAIDQHKPWRTLRADWRRIATAYQQEAKAMEAVRWPTRVQPAMNKWITALKADQGPLNRAAKATTEATFNATANQADGKRSYAAETKVLRALGLPTD